MAPENITPTYKCQLCQTPVYDMDVMKALRTVDTCTDVAEAVAGAVCPACGTTQTAGGPQSF